MKNNNQITLQVEVEGLHSLTVAKKECSKNEFEEIVEIIGIIGSLGSLVVKKTVSTITIKMEVEDLIKENEVKKILIKTVSLMNVINDTVPGSWRGFCLKKNKLGAYS